MRASVVGDFNGWDGRVHPMRALGASGVWEMFIPAAQIGAALQVRAAGTGGEVLLKTDPFGLAFEVPPLTASIVCQLRSTSGTTASGWRRARRWRSWFERPLAVYEVHLGSWARAPEEAIAT